MNKALRAVRDNCIKQTKQRVRESINSDLFINQCINNLQEIDKVANTHIKRLREWYAYYNPEFEKKFTHQRKFCELILKKSKKELLKEVGYDEKESMGADLKKDDLVPIMDIAKHLLNLYDLKDKEQKYLEDIMKKTCPNITAIAGVAIGAKLIEIAGSLERLATFPASTLQILGAEKALFRHLKTGARPPKYGIIHEHPIISQVSRDQKGHAARVLADKLSIAARVDLFKGKFIGDKLNKEIKEKLKIK